MELKNRDVQGDEVAFVAPKHRRQVIFRLSVIFFSFLGSKVAFARALSNPQIDHLIGASVLPSGDSIVVIVGNHLEQIVSAKLSAKLGVAEIIMRDSTHLVILVNPKDVSLVGDINLRLQLANGWMQDLEIRLICDPSQLCFHSCDRGVDGKYSAMSRYYGVSRYSSSARYARSQYPEVAHHDEIAELTYYIGEHLL